MLLRVLRVLRGRFLCNGTYRYPALEIQQEFLSPEPATVAAKLPVLFHDPVTRNDDRNSVIAVRSAYRALRTRPSNLASLLLVADCLTIRNTLKALPRSHLERRSTKNNRHRELLNLPREVELQLLLETTDMLVLSRHNSAVEPFLQATDLCFQHAAIGKLEKTNPFRGRASDHWSKRSQEPRDDKWRERITPRGCPVERSRERIAETAGGVEAVRVPDSFPLFTVPNVSKREPQAPSSLISVERDAVMAKEPATHATGVELGTTQILVLPTPSWLSFDASKKLLEPLGWLPRRLHRATPLAGTIACRHGVAD